MLHRRRFLWATALSGVAVAAPSPPPPASSSGAPLRLLQPLDPAADQQEQVRDYAAGVQLAVQVANKAGGAGGREVQVQTLPVQPDAQGLHTLQRRLREDPGLLGQVGCAGERLSLAVVDALSRSDPGIAHIAPWLHDARHDGLPQVLNLFASRDEQVRHTLTSLNDMGLRQIGVVYDGTPSRNTVQRGLDEALSRTGLQPPAWTAYDGIEAMTRRLPADAPPVLAFVGGAIDTSSSSTTRPRRPDWPATWPAATRCACWNGWDRRPHAPRCWSRCAAAPTPTSKATHCASATAVRGAAASSRRPW